MKKEKKEFMRGIDVITSDKKGFRKIIFVKKKKKKTREIRSIQKKCCF